MKDNVEGIQLLTSGCCGNDTISVIIATVAKRKKYFIKNMKLTYSNCH